MAGGLPMSGIITLSMIREELGKQPESNFSLNNAEDGGYVAINPCSTYKPSSPNPASLSEWYGYNHTQPCVAYEFPTVSCDTNSGVCDQIFNSGQASQGLSMIVYTGISFDGDSANDAWYITNAERFTNAYFAVRTSSLELIWEFQGTYTPWNGIANRGSLNGTKVPTGTYYFNIDYNDGSGRTISSYMYIYTANTNDPWFSQFSYSSASSSAACAATNWSIFGYFYPVGVGKNLYLIDNPNLIEFSFIGDAPAGYYKRRYTNNWYQVNSSGLIIATGTC